MTLQEAEKIVQQCREYIYFFTDELTCLDGDFTLQQLEAIVVIAKSKIIPLPRS